MTPKLRLWCAFAALSLALTACTDPSPSDSPTVTMGSDAILTVDIAPLREGFAAASLHQGPKRGVRRLLSPEDSEDGLSWVITAQRTPVLFKSRPSLCSTCALLEATIEIQVGHFAGHLVAGKSPEQFGRGSLLVRVPVHVSAARSMDRPGWWDVGMQTNPEEALEVQWVHQLPATASSKMDESLRSLGQEVVRAEALLLARRAPLMQFRAWQTANTDLRADVTELSVGRQELVVQLRTKAGPGELLSAEGGGVLGQQFNLQVSPGLAAALESEAALDKFVLSDARGKPGGLHPQEHVGERVVLSGRFASSTGPRGSRVKPVRAKNRLVPQKSPQ